MNTPEAQDITEENESVENNPETDRTDRTENATGRKRKRYYGALPRSENDYSSDSDTSTDSEAPVEERVIRTNQKIRRTMDCFEAALDNFINYHIEIEHADEERVFLLRQTMTRIYEIIRSSSYFVGALAVALQKPPV